MSRSAVSDDWGTPKKTDEQPGTRRRVEGKGKSGVDGVAERMERGGDAHPDCSNGKQEEVWETIKRKCKKKEKKERNQPDTRLALE